MNKKGKGNEINRKENNNNNNESKRKISGSLKCKKYKCLNGRNRI